MTMELDRASWSTSEVLDLYLGGASFICLTGRRIFRLRFVVVSLSPFGQRSGKHLDLATTSFFQTS
jgi:hypothetical protein